MTPYLLTYSMIRTLYDSGDDYIDCFWPFTVRTLLKKGRMLSLEEIQATIAETYGLEIPVYSLGTIITRAKRRGLLSQRDKGIELTPAGQVYANRMEDEAEVSRRVNELLDDASTFLEHRFSLSISLEGARVLIQAFIKEHIEFFANFINPVGATSGVGIRDDELQLHEAALLEYFRDVERRRPMLFSTLRDIVLGSIISAIIQSESFANATRKFGHTAVYLDTNFLFNVFGLHFEQFNRPAKELLDLMKVVGSFELRVFDFTVDELVQVLRAYTREQHRYLPHLPVNSIYSSIKAKGWTPADVMEFVANIEERLWEKHVRVQRTGVNLVSFKSRSSGSRDLLVRYKPNQGPRGQNHDLAAIEQLENLRGKSIRQIEHAKAIFLTSDVRLARYDLLEHGHREKSTIGEVVLDRVLTNLLWLKNPTTIRNLSLDSIIAMHSRELFIDRPVWDRFVETLLRLKADGRIVNGDISLLVYDRQTAELLRTYRGDESERLTGEFILQKVDEARERLRQEAEAKLAAQRAAFEEEAATKKEAFDAEISRAERAAADALLDELSSAKSEWRERADRVSRRLFVGAVCCGVGVLSWISIRTVPLVVKNWNIIDPVAWWIGLLLWPVLGLLGYRVDFLGLGDRIRTGLFNLIYRRMLKNAQIERIEARLFVAMGEKGVQSK